MMHSSSETKCEESESEIEMMKGAPAKIEKGECGERDGCSLPL